MTSSQERRLLAVMFTDVVGYTAMMQRNEEEARIVRRRHREALDAAVPTHGGDLLQYLGDGSLTVFPSVVDAVRAAIEVQQGLLQEPVVPLRIGIHQGDISYDTQGAYRDSVNIASRIQSLGTAGSILISAKAHDEIKNRPDISATWLGEFELKNIEEALSVYAIVADVLDVPTRDDILEETPRASSTASDVAPAGAGRSGETSVVVLPLDNLSPDPDNAYFADGLTEEIIADLSQVGDLRVISRTSAIRYRSSDKDIPTIARELNVGYVLEGSVRRAGQTIRVIAQLIEAESDHHLWSGKFGGSLDNVLEIQESISREIVDALKVSLSEDEADRLGGRREDDPTILELDLRVRHEIWKATADSLERAQALIDSAGNVGAESPRLLATRASVLFATVNLGFDADESRVVEAEALARRAMTMDPECAPAYSTLAAVLASRGNLREALPLILRACQLDPSNSEAKVWLLYVGSALGCERALDLEAVAEQLIARDPF